MHIIIFLKNGILETLKKKLLGVNQWNRSTCGSKSSEILLFWLNFSSMALEIHKGAQERAYLSVRSIKSRILLYVRRKSVPHKIWSCGPHISLLPSLKLNLWNWQAVAYLHICDVKQGRNRTEHHHLGLLRKKSLENFHFENSCDVHKNQKKIYRCKLAFKQEISVHIVTDKIMAVLLWLFKPRNLYRTPSRCSWVIMVTLKSHTDSFMHSKYAKTT